MTPWSTVAVLPGEMLGTNLRHGLFKDQCAVGFLAE
jgi:hypothetical protein